jgi:hypothetical protein
MDSSVASSGRFTGTVELSAGQNAFELRSEDAAGNVGRKRVVIVRGESTATVVLAVSDPSISFAELPRRVSLRALVRDDEGRPLEGAEVTFGLSPPSQTTRTFQVAVEEGVAVWQGIDLERVAGNRGTWLATVLVTLPSGAELRDDEQFVIE